MVASRCGGKVVLPMDFGFPPSAMTMLAVIAFLGSLALPPPPRTRWESSQKLEAVNTSICYASFMRKYNPNCILFKRALSLCMNNSTMEKA
ncbi:hypothetical protein V6N13_033078 [Hibiscus sabdariffa]